MRRIAAALFALACCACDFHHGAQADKPIPIVFDDWWNVDYVKNGCEMVQQTKQNDRYANVKLCPFDTTPEQVVRDFENELEVAFATEHECHGLSLLHFTPEMANSAVKDPGAPAMGKLAVMAKPQWTLMLDLDGASETQSGMNWSLADPLHHIVSGHITTPQRTIEQVCKVARGVGGKVED